MAQSQSASVVDLGADTEAEALPLGQTKISGRIDSNRRISETSHSTLMTLPNPDPMQGPARVDVRSRNPFGQIGETVTKIVQVGGYTRQAKTRDGTPFTTCDNVLRLVD